MKKNNTVLADVLHTVTRYFLILVAVIVLLIGLSGLRVVKSGEVALILRFGKLVGHTYEEQVHEPGLMFAFPYVVDEIVTVPVGSVMEQSVTSHYTAGNMTTLRNNGYVVTGDRNIAVISASVKYAVTDPVAYALNVRDVPSLIDAFVSNAMVEAAAGISVDTLLTSGKDDFAETVRAHAQKKLDVAGVGIGIGSVELTTVSMPAEVREIYDQVNSASVQAATELEQARVYRENLLPSAKSQADTLIAQANAQRSQAVAAANKDLAEFWGVLEEYRLEPEVVLTRIYSAKTAQAMGKIGKVRVVTDGNSKIFLE